MFLYIYSALFLISWLLLETIIKVIILKITHNNINTISIGYIRFFSFTAYKTTIDIGLLPLSSEISYESLIFKTKVKKAFENILINLILIILFLIISVLLMGVDLWLNSLFQLLSIFDISSGNTVISLKGFSKLEMIGFFTLVLFFFNLLPFKGTYIWNILHSISVDLLNKKVILSIIEYSLYGFIAILFLVNYLPYESVVNNEVDKVTENTKEGSVLSNDLFMREEVALLAYKYSIKEDIVFKILKKYKNGSSKILLNEFDKKLTKDSFSTQSNYNVLLTQISSEYKIEKSTLVDLIRDYKIFTSQE